MRLARVARASGPATAVVGVLLAGFLVPGPAAAAPTADGTGAYLRPCLTTTAPGDATCQVVVRDAPRTATPHAAPATANAPVPDGITPSQLRAIYGVAGLSAPAGTTVGIVVAYDTPDVEADLATFRTTFGLPACTTANGCFRKVDQRGKVVPANKSRTSTVPPVYRDDGWQLETTLDTQAVSAMCPSCRILLVEADSNDLNAALGPAVLRAQALGATVISNSFAVPENQQIFAADQNYWSRTTVPVFAGSGDYGYDNYAGTSGQGTAYYPASSPSVISVGGTSADVSGNTVTAERAWVGSGSGCAFDFAQPASQKAYFAATGTRPDSLQFCDTRSGAAARASADLSAMADPDRPGFPVYRPGGWTIAGGTSLSVQLVAALAAYAGPRNPQQSTIATVAYGLAAVGAGTGLADITSGSNNPSGGPGCGGERICVAAAGWDGPTGLGTPRGTALFAPLLTLGATTILPGGTVGATGSNFVPGETVRFTSGGVAVGSATVSSYGTWSGTVTAPFTAKGTLPVTVTGSQSGFTASATLTVPAASLAVPSATLVPGQAFTATASNMAVGESVDFSVPGNPDVVVTAGADGTARTSLSVPLTAGSSVVVTATGADSGLAPTGAVTVAKAAVTVSPTAVAPGVTITVTASGFGIGDVVQVSAPGADAPDPVTVGSTGSFSVPLTVPASARGSVVVTATATSGTGRSASATVQVPSNATLALPSTIAAGASATLSGAAFASGEALVVSSSTGARQVTLPSSLSAQADGTVAATVSVPTTACPTTTTVTVRGTSSGRSASATFSTPAAATLYAGCQVTAGATFRSPSGQYRLVLQGDGNLVLYFGSRALWATGSKGASPRLVLQSDGNLVLYTGSKAFWATGTAGAGAGARVVLQDDGNLVLYDAAGRARWGRGLAGTDALMRGDVLQTGWYLHTSSSNYRLVMQPDGNLVEYTAAGGAVWASRTSGAGAYATLQTDGNMVVYAGGKAGFSTGTNGRGYWLKVQVDGNLVVYDSAGRAVWHR